MSSDHGGPRDRRDRGMRTGQEPAASVSPVLGADRVDALVTTIMERAAPELARRAAAGGAIAVLGRWSAPLLATAASVAAAAVVTLALGSRPGSAEAAPVLAEAVVPTALAEWVISGEHPRSGDLLLAYDDEDAR